MLANDTMWLQDTGVLVKMKYDVLNPPPLKPQPKVWIDKPLNLDQLGIIMIFLGVGTFSSISVFFFEVGKTHARKGGIISQSQLSTGREKEERMEHEIRDEMVNGEWNREEQMDRIEIIVEEIVST